MANKLFINSILTGFKILGRVDILKFFLRNYIITKKSPWTVEMCGIPGGLFLLVRMPKEKQAAPAATRVRPAQMAAVGG